MLSVEKGNMEQVYLDWRRDAEQAAELATMNAITNPIEARITGSANWHVVTTVTGHENVASAFLVSRRFGVFDPHSRETVVRRGRKVDRVYRLLPGYLIVFVWGLDQQKDRILSCPGVLGILKNGDGAYAVVPDHVIDDMRRWELSESPVAAEVAAIAYREEILAARPKLTRKQRRYRNQALTEGQPEQPTKLFATERCYSALDADFEALDDATRISRFNAAIGVGS